MSYCQWNSFQICFQFVGYPLVKSFLFSICTQVILRGTRWNRGESSKSGDQSPSSLNTIYLWNLRVACDFSEIRALGLDFTDFFFIRNIVTKIFAFYSRLLSLDGLMSLLMKCHSSLIPSRIKFDHLLSWNSESKKVTVGWKWKMHLNQQLAWIVNKLITYQSRISEEVAR